MMRWKLLKVFLILLGVLSLILAMTIASESVGSYEFSETYGGDAYTGIQNAAAQAANNILSVGYMIRTAASYMLLTQGLGCVMLGLCIRTKKKTAPAPTETEVSAASAA